ncbi:MAG: ribonuclease D [Anaerolineae bacterium]|nr:ribonuclease D [Anaerolineae bacterium]
MPKFPFPPATLIKSPHALEEVVNILAREPLIGIDSESNSLHAYQERVCLIQISTRTHDYLIDPLSIPDLSALGAIFASETVEKVFHGAEYDIVTLKRDFGFEFNSLFDTMIAAKICNVNPLGLNHLLQSFLNVSIDKRHQLDNWGIRPLPQDSLLYAQMDSHYLPQLRDILMVRLKSLRRLPDAQRAFIALTKLAPSIIRQFDPSGFWNIAEPHQLSWRELAVLHELYVMRDTIAQTKDAPPMKIITNQQLLALAQTAPKSSIQLEKCRVLSYKQRKRYGKAILNAIKSGFEAQSLPPPPELHGVESLVADRYTALYTWRKERAQQDGVEVRAILPKQVLLHIAQQPPSDMNGLKIIKGVGELRAHTYGEDILHILEKFDYNDE